MTLLQHQLPVCGDERGKEGGKEEREKRGKEKRRWRAFLQLLVHVIQLCVLTLCRSLV